MSHDDRRTVLVRLINQARREQANTGAACQQLACATAAHTATVLEDLLRQVPQSPSRGVAYVAANGQGDKFRAVGDDGWCTWVDDINKAVKYFSRADCEATHANDEDAWFVYAVEVDLDGECRQLRTEIAALRERVADQETSVGQAAEFALYVSEHAKGAMVEAAKKFLSVPYAQMIRSRLNALEHQTAATLGWEKQAAEYQGRLEALAVSPGLAQWLTDELETRASDQDDTPTQNEDHAAEKAYEARSLIFLSQLLQVVEQLPRRAV